MSAEEKAKIAAYEESDFAAQRTENVKPATDKLDDHEARIKK